MASSNAEARVSASSDRRSAVTSVVLGLAGGEGGDPLRRILGRTTGATRDPLANASSTSARRPLSGGVELSGQALDLRTQLLDLGSICALAVADDFQNFLA